MTTKILALCFALVFVAATAMAQDAVKGGDVPKDIFNKYAEQTSKSAAKKASWVKTPTSYTAEYEGTSVRLDNSGNIVWTSQKIERSAVDAEIMKAYKSKYDAEYIYQWAESVTLVNGETRTFIIGRKGDFNYYFKYNDKKLMVEKTATCK